MRESWNLVVEIILSATLSAPHSNAVHVAGDSTMPYYTTSGDSADIFDPALGKTHVAIFRILAEIERNEPSKLVWFLAPSVALCGQQNTVLASHLPGYVVKLLVGRDGVDKWSDQRIWDAALKNVRVVVGTPKVLEDALTHGFVQMSRLSLLVFDEAHRCIKNDPMNTIMTRFFHPTKDSGQYVPHVLGLSASPVMGAELDSLNQIEANLDARAITPKQHRSELDLYVHPPDIRVVVYKSVASVAECYVPPLCQALDEAFKDYDLCTDPYVLELKSQDDERRVASQMRNPTTFCFRQLKAIKERSDSLLVQLGATAAEWYIRRCIERFLQDMPSNAAIIADVEELERQHLAEIFHRLQSTSSIAFMVCLSIPCRLATFRASAFRLGSHALRQGHNSASFNERWY